MLSEWTRGAYVSTQHRVRHNSESLRISIPFFFDPNIDAFISPVLPGPDGVVNENEGIRYIDKFTRSLEQSLFKDSFDIPPMVDAAPAVATSLSAEVGA
jgi:isopenicillin N synthase-like dioxygenase